MKKTIIILILLAIILIAAAVYYFFFMEKGVEKNAKNSNTNQSANYSEFTQIYDQYIEAGKNGDLEKLNSYVYYSKGSSSKDNLSDDDYQKLIDSIKKTYISTYNNLSYSVKEANINEDGAVLTLSAVKNGRQKQDVKVYFIKDEDQWKINKYGWQHPPDSQVESQELCKQYCEENGYGRSTFYVPTKKDCFCYYYYPEKEGLENYKIEECEQREIDFQDGCYIKVATGQKNENYCKNIRSVNIEYCYKKVAETKQDASVCDYLWDDESCLTSIKSPETNTNLNINQTSVNQNININSTLDQDGDGLSDSEEAEYGTDPAKADTDGDGYDDKTEIDNGFNPNGEGKL